MSIGSVSSAAIIGVTRATEQLDSAAARTAGGEADPGTTTGALVAAKVQMAASVAVARAANEMMGTLVDLVM